MTLRWDFLEESNLAQRAIMCCSSVCAGNITLTNCNNLLSPHYSYAGLHCVVIKGYSKSAGYQPGVKFEDNRFRNSWNAVYVAGAWRFVQCNWGARHLVNAKEVPKPGKAKSDSLRYSNRRIEKGKCYPQGKLATSTINVVKNKIIIILP